MIVEKYIDIFRRAFDSRRFSTFQAVVVIALTAGIGTALLSLTRAATPVLSVEPENGLLSGVANVPDPTASGGGAISFGSGASAQPAGSTSVRDFGAKGDGVNDDAPAIRAAMAAHDSVYIPAGTYILKSFTTPRPSRLNADFMFVMRSNQTLTADPAAKLRFADGSIVNSPALWGGSLFLIDTQSNVTITGGTYDFNGNNNLVHAGQKIPAYGVYAHGAQHITVSNLTMRDSPGRNYIVMQARGDDFKVLNSSFINGGTSLPANKNQDDYSAMYFTGSHVVVDRVKVTNDVQPRGYSGGVELHGTQSAVTNSTIEKSWPAVYIGPDAASNLALMEIRS